MLFDHVACGRARSDELRLQDRCQWHHKFSIARSTAFFPFPYSFARGPTALNTMSMLPACFTMPSMYSSTVASSSASITAACTRSAICRDLLGLLFHVRLSPAGQKDLGAFGGELLGDGSANR